MENEISILQIEKKIFVIRGVQVMIDRDIAELYGVETRRLNEQVKRNIERFPEEFMIQLNEAEFENWKSQIAISDSKICNIKIKIIPSFLIFHTASSSIPRK
ncbi:MAG: ORF6N domain-containing protein [Treponema sp.]|nr:ORF6N domain-containing protein [Treponema sp.]